MTGIHRTDVKDFFQKSCLSTPSHLSVTAPVGHTPPLRSVGTSTASVSLSETSLTLRCGPEGTASVSLTETSLTLRCGPEGPCYRNPVCLNPSHSVTAPY